MTTKKKGGKKKTKVAHTKHKSSSHENVSSARESGVEKILIENFVSLQKVMTNLSVKFDSLST